MPRKAKNLGKRARKSMNKRKYNAPGQRKKRAAVKIGPYPL